MEVKILLEAGFEEAVRGMSYSFKDRAEPVDEWWGDVERRVKAYRRAEKLSQRGGGHNDFLKQIMVWIDIEAPRYWWSEMDTYHFVWKNSESTMHTLKKRDLTAEDFDLGGCEVAWGAVKQTAEAINFIRKTASVQTIKAMLPESYLQRRMCTTNYMALANIMGQRYDHRLPEWQLFCNALSEQLEHPQFMPRCV